MSARWQAACWRGRPRSRWARRSATTTAPSTRATSRRPPSCAATTRNNSSKPRKRGPRRSPFSGGSESRPAVLRTAAKREGRCMSRWRVVVVLVLIAFPVVILAGAGVYFLWKEGIGFYLWWPMAACMALGYLLGWYWQRKRQLLPPVVFTPSLHWTDRDRQAWQLVEA